MVHANPYFLVERITVFPSGLLTNSEYQFLDRQARGMSLLELDLKKISGNLERNPKIARAEVVRILPNQINVFLTRRTPIIQIQLKPKGPYYLVARDQMVLLVEETPVPELEVLEDYSSAKKSYSLGSLYQNKYFQSLSSILDSIKEDPILSSETVAKLTMDELGNITLMLNDGIELKTAGTLRISPNAKAVLGSLLKSDQRNQILYIDMRYRDLIVKRKSQIQDVPAPQKLKTTN